MAEQERDHRMDVKPPLTAHGIPKGRGYTENINFDIMKRTTALIIILASLLCGCARDRETPACGMEAEVLLQTFFPGTLVSRGGDVPDDRVIDELDLLIFKNGKYQYRRKAFVSGNAYKALLKTDGNITIHAFANCRSLLDSYDNNNVLAEGNDWDTVVRPGLVSDIPATEKAGTLLLPMWGTKEGVNIAPDIINDIGSVEMLRSVASADVVADVNGSEFELTEAYLYFAASEGILAPLSSNYNHATGYILNPESPVSMETTEVREATGVKGNSIKDQLYMFENDTDQSTRSDTRHYTRLVVGGKYAGSGKVTYYPLDFQEGNTLQKVTRNCKYEVVISKVNGAGYETAAIASEAAAVNMEFSVIEWNRFQDTDIFVDGPDHISIDTRTVILEQYAGKSGSVSVNTTFGPGDIKMEFRGTRNGAFEETGNGIRNSRFMAETMVDNGEIYSFRITALGDYSSDAPETNVQTLRITAKRIVFDIRIIQMNYNSSDWGNGGNEIIEGLS